MGVFFVDHVQVSVALSRLRADARDASAEPAVTPVTGLYEQGGTGAASIATLSRTIGDLGEAIGLNLGFTAAAAANVAANAATADGSGPR